MSDTEKNAHAAALIRLQVAANALEDVLHEMGIVRVDFPEAARDQFRVAEALAQAALEIARGSRTDVPAALRERSTWGLIHDTETVTRLLETHHA